MIFSAITIFTGTISFWTVKSEEIVSLLTNNNYGLKNYTDYPITIYGKGVQGILSFVIPYALTGYYPVAYILGKDVPYPSLSHISPLVAVIAATISYIFWNYGLRHYGSAGS